MMFTFEIIAIDEENPWLQKYMSSFTILSVAHIQIHKHTNSSPQPKT